MKIIIRYIYVILIPLCLISCEDYLDRESDTDTSLDYEDIFKDIHGAPGFINNAYNRLPVGYYRMGDALWASACDEAKHSEGGSLIQLFNNLAISASSNPDNVWSEMYAGIRSCNIFLKEIADDGLIVKYNSIPEANRNDYKGQAYFLRAFFHFELLKRYQNIFCVDKVLDPFDEDEIYTFEQKTFHEAKDFIVSDCDSAFKYLPEKFTEAEKDKYGRPTKAAPLALKSRLLLYAASPLNNPDNKKELWEAAEEAAKFLYDNARNYNLNFIKDDYASIFTTPYNSEIIFATKGEETNQIEQNNFPISYQGKGLTNPTQDLVDAYPMASTYYSDPLKDYDPENPYLKRDKRFYATVLYNDASFKDSRIESYVGGKDGLYSTSTSTKTGYYLRKFVVPAISLEKNERVTRSWILFRMGEVVLNYAEARNEVLDSPGNDKVLHDLLNLIRNRAGLRPFRNTTQYINDKDEMREYIRKERRLELAMEEHRFWDLRRWKDAETLSKPIHGMQIQKVENGVDEQNNPLYKFTYETFEVEKREFDQKFFWYPIPRQEILKYNSKGIKVEQNPGW